LHLEKCRVLTQDPPTGMFGREALKLATQFKMRPLDGANHTTANSPVIIPLTFVMTP
jgi:hypothetical protein